MRMENEDVCLGVFGYSTHPLVYMNLFIVVVVVVVRGVFYYSLIDFWVFPALSYWLRKV